MYIFRIMVGTSGDEAYNQPASLQLHISVLHLRDSPSQKPPPTNCKTMDMRRPDLRYEHVRLPSPRPSSGHGPKLTRTACWFILDSVDHFSRQVSRKDVEGSVNRKAPVLLGEIGPPERTSQHRHNGSPQPHRRRPIHPPGLSGRPTMLAPKRERHALHNPAPCHPRPHRPIRPRHLLHGEPRLDATHHRPRLPLQSVRRSAGSIYPTLVLPTKLRWTPLLAREGHYHHLSGVPGWWGRWPSNRARTASAPGLAEAGRGAPAVRPRRVSRDGKYPGDPPGHGAVAGRGRVGAGASRAARRGGRVVGYLTLAGGFLGAGRGARGFHHVGFPIVMPGFQS